MTISSSSGIDYSALFSSLNTSSSSSSSTLYDLMTSIDFTELNSIRSGTYKMALDAYYSNTSSSVSVSDGSVSFSEDASSSSSETYLTEAETAELAQYQDIQETSSTLSASADKLLSTSYGAVFEETNIITQDEDGVGTLTRGYDVDAIYDEISTFVSSYNELVTSASSTSSSSLNSQVSNMVDIMDSYASTLEGYGITMNEDNTLTIDEETFKASDMESVKDTFASSYSIGSRISDSATYVNNLATYEVNKSTSYGYSSSATYDDVFSSGNLYDSLF